MTDIVDRLRRGAAWVWDQQREAPDWDGLLVEAADEIERLREQVEWLKPFAERGLGDAFEADEL